MRLCELPSSAPVISVGTWVPHGCDGYYMIERLWYGPYGVIGRDLSGSPRWE